MEQNAKTLIIKGLKKYIRGDIHAHISDNRLIVDIQPLGVFTFHYVIENIFGKIATKYDCEILAREISKQYANYILASHFTDFLQISIDITDKK